MKNRFYSKTFLALVLSSFLGVQAFAEPVYELATLLGTPNREMPFVQEVGKNHIAIAPGENVADFTTGVLYFAWKNGTERAQTLQVIGEGGYASLEDVFSAIDIASRDASIVFAPLAGDRVEEMCSRMAEKKETAFLVSLGAAGYMLSPFFTKCASRNILFVTVLNKELTGLGEYASYGPLVRLAVPGMDLSAPVDSERRVSFLSDGFGMAVAAGKLSALVRKNPSLKGAALLSQFLADAEYLPSLRGKVTGAKAIRSFEQ